MKAAISQLRRQRGRWWILRVLQAARPIGVYDRMIGRILADDFPYSPAEIRRELAWLRDAGMIEIIERDALTDDDRWAVKLTRDGIDVAEYSVPPPAGIRRPQVRHAAV
jgi:hypothetical protein